MKSKERLKDVLYCTDPHHVGVTCVNVKSLPSKHCHRTKCSELLFLPSTDDEILLTWSVSTYGHKTVINGQCMLGDTI